MKNFYFLLILFCSSSLISQTTIVFQPDAAAGKDAKIFNLNTFQNYGDDLDFIAATWTFSQEPGTLRSVIQFDLSSIPAGAGILEAKLSLYYNFVTGSAGQAGNNAAYLRRITDNWDEHTVNWNNQPSFTNANQVYLPESTASDQDYEDVDVAPLIRDMLADPSHSYGFMFMGQVEAVLSSMKFFSSDAAQESQRPKLSITYTNDPIQCLTIQPGNEGKDAKVFSLNPGTNFGNDLDFIGAAWTFGGIDGILRSYLDFDLSGIPQNTAVVSAALSLYYNEETSSEGQEGMNSAVLQRVIDPWNEQTINWNNQPASTSVNQVILPVSTSMNQDYTGIDVTNLVLDILANPSVSDGFMLKQITEQSFRSMKFSSSDVSDPAKHPKLEICYHLTTSHEEIDFQEAIIQPNPFNNSFLIQHVQGPYSITITDLSGKMIRTLQIESLDNAIFVDKLDDLPSGIYFIRAFSENGNFFTKGIKASRQ